MRAALFFNNHKENSAEDIQNITNKLAKCGFEVLLQGEHENTDSILHRCDVVIVAGGDGTILRYAKLSAQFSKLILGINNGSIGFLAELKNNQVGDACKIISGDYKISKRMLLEVSFEMNGEVRKIYTLNDVVISRGPESQIVKYDIIKSGGSVCKFRADGVIIATPTGSTAYSLSAGGPIVEPTMECVAVTPVCAFSLDARPRVLSAGKEITVECTVRSGSEVVLAIDGEVQMKSDDPGLIKIKKADITADFIAFEKRVLYESIS